MLDISNNLNTAPPLTKFIVLPILTVHNFSHDACMAFVNAVFDLTSRSCGTFLCCGGSDAAEPEQSPDDDDDKAHQARQRYVAAADCQEGTLGKTRRGDAVHTRERVDCGCPAGLAREVCGEAEECHGASRLKHLVEYRFAVGCVGSMFCIGERRQHGCVGTQKLDTIRFLRLVTAASTVREGRPRVEGAVEHRFRRLFIDKVLSSLHTIDSVRETGDSQKENCDEHVAIIVCKSVEEMPLD